MGVAAGQVCVRCAGERGSSSSSFSSLFTRDEDDAGEMRLLPYSCLLLLTEDEGNAGGRDLGDNGGESRRRGCMEEEDWLSEAIVSQMKRLVA